MSDDIPEILQRETPEQYQQDAANYFKNLKHQEIPGSGLSADDLSHAQKHLMTKQQEAAYADRVDLAANKTRRTGAQVAKGANVPGLFLHGIKQTSELIDEFTPGKYEQPEEMKPPSEQIAPTGFFEAAEAVIETFCLDCLEPFSPQDYTLGMTIATEDDAYMCGGKVNYGATVLYIVCGKCWNAAKEISRDKTPLVLIFNGGLIPEKDIAIAIKYGFPVSLHEGTEKTKGQWEMAQRAERMMAKLWEVIASQGPDSLMFTRNRKKPA